MPFAPEEISKYTGIARDIATIVGVLVAAAALGVSARTTFRTFDNRKREFAATLAYNFAKDEEWLTTLALELVRSERPFVCKVINREPTYIPAEFYEIVYTILKTRQDKDELPNPPTGNPSGFCITSTQSQMIRFLWVDWVNKLEGVLSSWNHGTADKGIMESVWKDYIFLVDEKLTVLEEAAVKYCPAITEFRQAMKNKRRCQ